MDISIIGAGGTIGRQIAVALVQERILPPTSRLQLIGRADGRSASSLHALATDLADAYAETMPQIDIGLGPEDVLGDIIVVAAGATMADDLRRPPDRAALARQNLPMFEFYADALARHGHGQELVLVVSNPVELGVHVFSQRYPRERVIGMGAYLDTLRFRREIASDLGVRRQSVQGLVLGEHGPGMVPCWSTVGAFGFDTPEGRARLDQLRRRDDPTFAAVNATMVEVLARDGAAAAYRVASACGADVRTFIKPLITHLIAKTPIGSAEMIARLVKTIVDGEHTIAAAQVALAGDFLGITGVTGAPVVIANRGIVRIEPLALAADEVERVRAAAAKFDQLRRELGR